MNKDQLKRVLEDDGFIAALDQSGGSTPKALAAYGVDADQYNGDEEMFAVIHQMRCRIMTSPAFNGDRILGAILFERTAGDSVEGKPTAQYLWEDKKVVPFLKVDLGLADEENGVQVMKPIPTLAEKCQKGVSQGIFGTKMRSVIHSANADGIHAVVAQQFDFGKIILENGLVPIIEPEVNVKSAEKAACEDIMKAEILKQLDLLADDQKVMLKLTLPESNGLFDDLVAHKNVIRVVALSGGYSRTEACKRLSENAGIIASFSRALTEGLSSSQSDDEFNDSLDAAIAEILAGSQN